MIDELVVLGWVEDLEHRGRRITGRPAGRHLVDLVDHEDRVLHADATHRLNEQTGKCADVRAAVAANLGFVAHPADRDAIELASDRLRDRLA